MGRDKSSKHTVLVNADEVPLVIHTPAANESDQAHTRIMLSQPSVVCGLHVPPMQRPEELNADCRYDCEAARPTLCWLGMRSKIAR